MTNDPENLAEYRLILLLHAGDEPLEERVCHLHYTAILMADIHRREPQYRP